MSMIFNLLLKTRLKGCQHKKQNDYENIVR